MANETIHDQPLVTSADAADEIALWVVASSLTKRIAKANLLGGSLTGAGVLATGGFTLTVPATGTAALLARSQTFTADQTIAPTSTAAVPLIINTPAGVTVPPLEIKADGVRRMGFFSAAGGSTVYNTSVAISIDAFDNGAASGPRINIGRNSNASTPAAGILSLNSLGGTFYRVWADNAGNMRIHTADPTNAADTAGTVVGAQTSMAEAKWIVPGVSGIDEVLARIAHGAGAVRRFTYKSGAWGGQEFEGIVTDEAPDYGMDRDAEHPQGKSLNIPVIVGDLLRAVAHLAARVEQLEEARG